MILRRFFDHLSIGNKMAFGSALTGLFFLVALWQYHATLTASLDHHQQILSSQGTRGVPVRHIQNHLLEARRFEKIFVLQKDPHAATLALERVHLALTDARSLQQREADPGIRQRLAEVIGQLESYDLAVRNLFQTWEVIGLSHGVGLQGRFREAIHQVEESLYQLESNGLKAALERLHQEERNLLLFRGAEYVSSLNAAVDGLRTGLEKSFLEEKIRQPLLEKLELYRTRAALLGSGKGLAEKEAAEMRASLGEIDGALQGQLPPDLGSALLEMRRREKDFLLRGEEQYVEMVRSQLRGLVGAISGSALTAEVKQRVVEALARYEGDFLAMVEHTRHIKGLEKQLQESASRIESLTNTQLIEVDNAITATVHEIRERSAEGEGVALALVVLAMVNGVFFVYFISTRITRPVAEMIALAKIYAHSGSGKDGPLSMGLQEEAAGEGCNRSRDEIQTLFESMERMNANLRQVVQMVDTQAEGLECSSHELVEASNLLTRCADEAQSRAALMETEQGGMVKRWAQEMRTISGKTRKRAHELSSKAHHLNHLLDRIQW